MERRLVFRACFAPATPEFSAKSSTLDRTSERRDPASPMSAKDQVHSKFKLFAGSLGPGGSLGSLGTEVEQFAAKVKAAPKSIGVEYLEHSKKVVVSLGYRDDEAAYPIKLTGVS